MSCIVRNVVYATICKNCGHTYVGETVNLRGRMTAHRSNSRNIDEASQGTSIRTWGYRGDIWDPGWHGLKSS